MKKIGLLFLSVFLLCSVAFATHNRSGEITYEQISAFTYRIKVLTYTKPSSPADRPILHIAWGDGTSDDIKRKSEIIFGNDIKRNDYEGIHTFPGPATYKIHFEDPNRDANVINIPGSVNVPFYTETVLIIDPNRGGFNNSPVLLQPPIDKGAKGVVYYHNPNAWDPDGDSLSYKLIPCKGKDGLDIPGWTTPSFNNSYTLNALTGDLVWDSPQAEGEYNIAIKITEWRKDAKTGRSREIGSVTRDMQIVIEPTTNKPPVIASLTDICVEAGTKISFPVSATDPDAGQTVTLTATGGPFQLSSPAKFTTPSAANPITGTFEWQTSCDHIRKQPYQVVFKAEDNFKDAPLIDLKSIRITVVPPAPKNPVAIVQGDNVTLHWNPELCPSAVGYKIYRKSDSTAFTPGQCETGLPASTGFVQIGNTKQINDTTFLDDNNGKGLIHGLTYCYRIVAYFADGQESYTSVQVCVELKKDVPIMAQASVLVTDPTNGEVQIKWTKPLAADLDIIQNPGPYKFELYRTDDFGSAPATLIYTVNSPDLASYIDTTFIDKPGASANTSLLNTRDIPHSYYVKFYSSGNIFRGTARSASTIFLTITPTDNRLNLKWKLDVPWKNTNYNIFRKGPSQLAFTKIASTTKEQYSDSGLANGVLYCYYIESEGLLTGKGLPTNIVNLSQVSCAEAVDNILPCPPIASIIGDCDHFQNTITWDNPNKRCADDVLKYRIYFKKSSKAEFSNPVLDSLATSSPFTAESFNYIHGNLNTSIAGCYAISSVDSVGNEGPKSNTVCVDNCPIYKLPNIFTPNHDGYNDLFTPKQNYRFIQDVDIKIFNRWGQLVFSHQGDPAINWDGVNQNSHKECTEGTYYYICIVNEIHLDEITSRTLSGFVEIIRGKDRVASNE